MSGRFNLIDAAAAIVVLLLIPMGYVAWRVFHQPDPIIKAITPDTLSVDSPKRVRMTGEHFAPFLNAFVSKTNQPYSVPHRVADNIQAEFLVETPTDVELQLPNLDPGTYDLYLYDEGREVAHKAAAITLTPGERRHPGRVGEPVPNDAIVDFLVRFDVDSSIAPMIAANAVDLNRPERGAPQQTAARLVSVRTVGTSKAKGDATATTSIEAVVQAGVIRDHGIWVYPEGQRIRAGETFWFGTAAYVIDGLIIKIVSTQEIP
ncbi:MAG TPA: hypothetical protein VFA59_25200 [Vicinamibacterales bacterium]|nr:hypothetical protein [Vicinamibacterales bacterium]